VRLDRVQLWRQVLGYDATCYVRDCINAAGEAAGKTCSASSQTVRAGGLCNTLAQQMGAAVRAQQSQNAEPAMLWQGYTPPEAKESEYQTIPMSKIEDFGVHANQYYGLEVRSTNLLVCRSLERHDNTSCCLSPPCDSAAHIS